MKVEILSVSAVRFKRKKNSLWEIGVAIGEAPGDLGIVFDIKRKKVAKVYTYEFASELGAFTFTEILPEEERRHG